MAFEFVSNLEAVVRHIDNLSQGNMERACLFLINKIKRNLSGTRSGRIYRVVGTKRKYTASAPGEAPAVRTGRLRNSIKYTISGWAGLHLVGRVGTTLEYGAWLEHGTTKMDARPYIGPAAEESNQDIKRILGGG